MTESEFIDVYNYSVLASFEFNNIIQVATKFKMIPMLDFP